MKRGESINTYRIVTEPSTSGGGRCVWAFAERGGKPYFIKQFLDPKWPTEKSMGSPAGKQRRREECLEFEERHRSINDRINGGGVGGGNLVTANDFFRDGTTYYKVTDRVAAVAFEDLRTLTVRQRAVVLRTLCQSMKLLHRANIVHGDLKTANILLQKSATSDLFTAKMIDFDDSYLGGDPPPPDQIVGDQQYGAPEWLRYVKSEPDVRPADLTTATDIFAMGLVFHQYLAGELPGYDRARFGAPAEAVWSGEELRLSRQLHPDMAALITAMTARTPSGRPTVDHLINRLNDDALLGTPATTSAPTVTGRIKTNMSGTDGDPPPRTPPPRRPDGGSRVRFHFDR